MIDTSKTRAQKEAEFKSEDVDVSLRKLLSNDDEEDLYRDEEMAEKVQKDGEHDQDSQTLSEELAKAELLEEEKISQ